LRTPARIGILIRPHLSGREQGRLFFEFLRSSLPGWVPDRYGISEPVRDTFSFEKLESILDRWVTGFIFKRRQPRTDGHVLFGSRYRGLHDVVYLSAHAKEIDMAAVRVFVDQLNDAWGVDLAYVHQGGGEQELSDLEYYDRCIAPFGQGLTTHDLKKGLPGLSWAMLFGKPYVDFFGRQQLASAPAALTCVTPSDLAYIQGTSSLVDCIHNPGAVRAWVSGCIEHLGTDAFVLGRAQSAKWTPDFRWEL
jgi:hypothetical protein